MVSVSWCVDPVSAIKQVRIQLHNQGNTALDLRITGMVEWLLGEQRSNRSTLVTQAAMAKAPATGVLGLLCTQTDRETALGGGTAFLCARPSGLPEPKATDWTCDRRTFFDPQGQLWVIEMGPKGGDELNKIIKAKNYGYPIVSNGDHYDGRPIPDHSTRPEFEAPVLDWTPVISPSDLLFYTGNVFPQWKNKAIATGLSSKAIVIIDTAQTPVKEVQRLDMKERIRGIVQAQDGSLWVIQDGSQAGLLKMTAP
jgi:hypothetical protein